MPVVVCNQFRKTNENMSIRDEAITDRQNNYRIPAHLFEESSQFFFFPSWIGAKKITFPKKMFQMDRPTDIWNSRPNSLLKRLKTAKSEEHYQWFLEGHKVKEEIAKQFTWYE